ncbi:ribonuclease Y [Patescibacteria group bacterium]|nr:ribonuclease Y [Patescibacteria group bacterium]
MNQIILLSIGVIFLAVGAILGYYARQSIARRQIGTLEEKIQKRVSEAKNEAQLIIAEATEKASQVLGKVKKDIDQRQASLLRTEQLLLKRENILDNKFSLFEKKEKEFQEKVQALKKIKKDIEGLKEKVTENLEKVSKLSKEEAKKELFENLKKNYQAEILEKIRRLEKEGTEQFEKKAKGLIATAMQRVAISQAQELTTTTISLPSDDIKGRIIGKEGRNIRTLERLTGVEIIVDDTPGAVVISGFDPIRRQIAKIALEKLISDGRIQPARIEDEVSKAEVEVANKIKEAGEEVVYETGLVGLHPKLVQLLGRLNFRTSYGQNVLLHSLEVSYLAEALASEIGGDAQVSKKAGLFHDIGKAVDHQIQGSHVVIGMKILEKFDVEKEIIDAMKSHHEEFPYDTLESVIVQVADQISGARPGARKDTVENYLKRLADLEDIAISFPGIDKAWALQAGRELRVFVKPEDVDDLTSRQLANDIAKKIEEELRYPGEIKVTVVRESRVIEYAR